MITHVKVARLLVVFIGAFALFSEEGYPQDDKSFRTDPYSWIYRMFTPTTPVQPRFRQKTHCDSISTWSHSYLRLPTICAQQVTKYDNQTYLLFIDASHQSSQDGRLIDYKQ